MQKLPSIFILLCSLVACTYEYSPEPHGKESLPVILGELSPQEGVNIELRHAKNLSYNSAMRQKEFSKVALLDAESNELTKLSKDKNEIWKAAYPITAKKTYQLQLNWGSEQLKISTRIPDSFEAKIVSQKKTTTKSITATIALTHPLDTKAFWVIECFQFTNGTFSNLRFNNLSPLTDNYKYQELKQPFSHLFLTSNTAEAVQLDLELLYDEAFTKASDFIEIRIKNTTKSYYYYRYNSAMQEENDLFYLPNNNMNYLGMLGGCYLIKLKL